MMSASSEMTTSQAKALEMCQSLHDGKTMSQEALVCDSSSSFGLKCHAVRLHKLFFVQHRGSHPESSRDTSQVDQKLRPGRHSSSMVTQRGFFFECMFYDIVMFITSTHTETKNSFGDIFLFDSHSEFHSHGHRISGWASPLHHPQLLNLRNQSPQPIDPGFVSKQRETGRDGDNGQKWTRQNWALIMVLGSPMFPAIFLYILVVY